MTENTDRRPEWLRSWLPPAGETTATPVPFDDSMPEPWERPSKAMRWTPDSPIPFDRTAPDTDPTPPDEEF